MVIFGMRPYCTLFLILCFIYAHSAPNNEYWADQNGSQEHEPGESSNEDAANSDHADEDHGGGGGGGDEGQPPGPVEVVQDQPTTTSPCNDNALVKCLSDPLDEWAIALYSLKENIVAIKSEECLHSREMIDQCIKTTAAELKCDHAGIMRAAKVITDLLTHKKDSGNLLRSYYITAYVCTEEGRAIRDEVGEECLKQQHIGEMLFTAVKFMDDKISHNNTANGAELCGFLKQQSLFMREVAEGKCPQHSTKAGRLMCESIKMAFQTMYPEKFEGCKFECDKSSSPSGADGGDGGGGGGGGDTPAEGTNGNGQTGANHGGPGTADGTGGPTDAANTSRHSQIFISMASFVFTTAVFRHFAQRT